MYYVQDLKPGPLSSAQILDHATILLGYLCRKFFHFFESPGDHASGCHPSPGFPCFTFQGLSFGLSFCIVSPADRLSLASPSTPSVSLILLSSTPDSQLFCPGLSSTEGFAVHLASAACTRYLRSRCLATSACCSAIDGGVGLV